MAPLLPLRPQGAFALSEALRAQLLRRARNLCRGRFDAEDLVQEVLVTNLDVLGGSSALPEHAVLGRLFVSLKNAFISCIRHADAGDRFARSLPNDEPSTPPPGEPRTPTLSEQVTDAELREAMAALTPKQREVFLAVTAGERYADIALRLGITSGAVGKRVFDARRRLREVLVALIARRERSR